MHFRARKGGMPQEGEFELMLGNRQLISVFVIVVVLLGVFFSMGYIVGRNSGAGIDTASASTKAQPLVERSARNTPEPSPDSTRTALPTQEEQKAAESNATPGGEITKAEPPPADQKTERPPESAAVNTADLPPSGQYWQVAATRRPEAELVAEVLGKKGLHALLAPAPRDGLYRVLVGPLRDAADLAQKRVELENAGFNKLLHQKY